MATKKKALTIREWWEIVGTENVLAVVEKVGTSIAYMRMLSYRLKRPSYDMMNLIIASANEVTPGFVPDLTTCMEPLPKRKPNPNYTPKLQPSKEFIKATKGKVTGK